MAKITLKTIADKMNVSTVAVFKALNNQSGVSDPLRRKIKAYAKSVGYVGKSSHQGINKKRFLFFINQDFFLTPSEQYYSTIFYYLTSELAKVNSMLQISFLEPEQPVEKIKTTIANFNPDGVFFACEVSQKILQFMEKHPVPSVFIDIYSPLFSCNFLYVDNYQVSYMLAHYLIDKGHTKIGFIGNINKTTSISDRYMGYVKAMNEKGLRIDPAWHINENIERQVSLFDLPLNNLPTAYICHCDSAAQKLYSLLSVNGLKVPDDVSVISFDNTMLCENLMPKLTSVGPNKDSVARKAFGAMVDAIKGKHALVQLRSHLVERESVKDLNPVSEVID
ncbi:MAG TPA: LacI family DNA-binding transcriptional regulator [Bacilli bacterium]|nr:LacI family DNA-binding transcriptional regulator [Bacilli bacterium]